MKPKGKILHVFNLCGVPCVLSRLMIAEGYKAKVYGRYSQDERKYHEYYSDVFTAKSFNKYWYLVNLIYQLFRYRPNLVQVHYNRKFLKIVAKFKKRLRFKLVYHAHGGDLRGKPLTREETDLCDKIVVSTPDLLKEVWIRQEKKEYEILSWSKMIHLTNPIDPDFLEIGKSAKENIAEGSVLYPRARPIDRQEEVMKYLGKRKEKFLHLEIIDRIDGEGIFYADMIKLLPNFEYVLDWKGATEFELSPIKDGESQAETKGYMSNISFEALAMGCTVIFEDESVLFPKDIDFKKINRNWIEFYKELLE